MVCEDTKFIQLNFILKETYNEVSCNDRERLTSRRDGIAKFLLTLGPGLNCTKGV